MSPYDFGYSSFLTRGQQRFNTSIHTLFQAPDVALNITSLALAAACDLRVEFFEVS